jgi:phosphoribosyl-dephospho-CoA transferase
MIRRRHDLVEITETGRRWACKTWRKMNPHVEGAQISERMIAGNYSGVKLPGIVRREENLAIHNAVPVGFSSPFLVENRRVRVAAFAPTDEILKLVSPYQVMLSSITPRTKCMRALRQIKEFALGMGLTMGVWGSAGLEAYTGLPYTNEGSDLDLLLKPSETVEMFKFAKECHGIGRRHDLRVDFELDLPNGYGVNLQELMNGAERVLAKGIEDVILIPRDSILAMCS